MTDPHSSACLSLEGKLSENITSPFAHALVFFLLNFSIIMTGTSLKPMLLELQSNFVYATEIQKEGGETRCRRLQFFYFTPLSSAFTVVKGNFAPWIKPTDQLCDFIVKSIHTQ